MVADGLDAGAVHGNKETADLTWGERVRWWSGVLIGPGWVLFGHVTNSRKDCRTGVWKLNPSSRGSLPSHQRACYPPPKYLVVLLIGRSFSLYYPNPTFFLHSVARTMDLQVAVRWWLWKPDLHYQLTNKTIIIGKQNKPNELIYKTFIC